MYPKGNISKLLGDMKEGDTIEAKGPIPKLEYKPNKWKKIGMIAGAHCSIMYRVSSESRTLVGYQVDLMFQSV